MSLSSPEALYHPLPEHPPEIELSTEDLRATEEFVVVVDTRIRWAHFIFGCAVLLPWNAMITATPYFLSRLENSAFKPTFSSYLSTSFTAANLAFLAHATFNSKRSPPSRQITITLLGLSALTLSLTLSTYFRISPGIFFTFVLVNGMAQAALGSYLQTSVIAVASLFGPATVQSLMLGQAAVAVIISGVQVITAAASTWGDKGASAVATKDAEAMSAFVFFGLSTIFLLATVGIQRWLMTLSIYQSVVRSLEVQHTRVDGVADEHHSLVSGEGSKFHTDRKNILRVARANALYELAVAYVFVVTLAVFPPITASIGTVSSSTHALLFSAVHFLMFAVGDSLGRYLCSIPNLLVWSPKRLLLYSLARTLFIPLFLMCNIKRPSGPVSTIPPIINSDFLFMFILVCFGATNGYVSSLCMMAAPSLEHNRRLRNRIEDVDIAATVAGFCLVGGLALGSIASFGVRGIICQCNPFTQ